MKRFRYAAAALLLTAAVTVTTATAASADDDDWLVLNVTSLTVTEGGSRQFGVKAASQPDGDVAVQVTSSEDFVTVEHSEVTIFEILWDKYALVRVSASEDDDDDHESATITLTATRDGATESVTLDVTVFDNEYVAAPTNLSVHWNTNADDQPLTVSWAHPHDYFRGSYTSRGYNFERKRVGLEETDWTNLSTAYTTWYNDTDYAAGENQYRVQAWYTQSSGTTLTSDWTGPTSFTYVVGGA